MTNDRKLHQDVLEALSYEPLLNARDIGIAVHDGIVTLSGTVDTYFEKSLAERVCKRCAGVRGLAEELRVNPPKLHQCTDTDIARTALRALALNVYVPADRIQVAVEEGWLTLEGTVGHRSAMQHAVHAVAMLPGLRGVTNLIEVAPTVTPDSVKSTVKVDFQQHSGLDASRIRVDVDGRRVTLTGTVPTLADKEEAGEAAAAAPGVQAVVNEITVEPIIPRTQKRRSTLCVV